MLNLCVVSPPANHLRRVDCAVLPKLFLLFVIVPLVELTLLLMLASRTHWSVSLLLVIGTGAIGSFLARMQGWSTYRRIQQELRQGQLPTDSLMDAVLIFVAGALLLTPGMLTDVLGMSLLFPAGRRFYKARLVAWFKKQFSLQAFPSEESVEPQRHEIIDSYVVDASPEEEPDDDPEGESEQP